jgi:osmotically-inducible protein OsmY
VTAHARLDGATDPGPRPFDGTAPVLDLLRLGHDREAAESAAGLLATAGPGEDISLALTLFAAAVWHHGRLAEAISLLRAAIAQSARGASNEGAVQSRLTLASVLTVVGDFPAAEGLVNETFGFEPGGATPWGVRTRCVSARLHLAAGRLDEAATAAEQGLWAARRAAADALVPPLERVLAAVALYRRDMGAAADHVRRYRAGLIAKGWVDAAAYELTAAWLVDAREGPDRAYEVVSPLLDDPQAQRRLFALDPTAATFLVRTACRAGDRARAADVCGTAELLARDNDGFPTLVAAALHARGLVCKDHRLLREAANLHRHPWARASALEDVGEVLVGSDPAIGAAALEAAAALYRHAGADYDAARATARGRSAKHARPSRPVEGWESLTSGERRVADLVAEGLTNQEVACRLYVVGEHSDTDIARSAVEALKWNVLVPSDKIKVEVENGWLTLKGEVEYDYQRRAAERAIRNLPGVRNVTNLVTVKPRAGKPNPETVKAEIRRALERQAEIEASKIDVDVDGSAVVLSGTVHSWAERYEVEKAAWAAPGVTEVRNRLSVMPIAA